MCVWGGGGWQLRTSKILWTSFNRQNVGIYDFDIWLQNQQNSSLDHRVWRYKSSLQTQRVFKISSGNDCVINRQNNKRTDLQTHKQTARDCEVYITQQTLNRQRTKDSKKKKKKKSKGLHVRLRWSNIRLYKASDTMHYPSLFFFYFIKTFLWHHSSGNKNITEISFELHKFFNEMCYHLVTYTCKYTLTNLFEYTSG